jgi:hypothetical protein
MHRQLNWPFAIHLGHFIAQFPHRVTGFCHSDEGVNVLHELPQPVLFTHPLVPVLAMLRFRMIFLQPFAHVWIETVVNQFRDQATPIAVALYFIYYNFCRVHSTLRVTPAMEAGISDQVWSVEELCAPAASGAVGHEAHRQETSTERPARA